MNASDVVIFPNDDGWSLGRGAHGVVAVEMIPATAGAAPGEAIRALAGWLKRLGLAHPALLLAIPSNWVLTAPIDTAELPRRQRAAALKFRLEEKLPIAAEDLSSAFIESDSSALAVAVPLERLRLVLKALADHGLTVRHVVPAALLALQHIQPDLPRNSQVCLWEQAGRLEVFRLVNARPAEWAHLPQPQSQLPLQLRAQASDAAPLRVVSRDLSPSMLDLLRRQSDVQVIEHQDASLADAATQAGLAALAGAEKPWADLAAGFASASGPARALSGTAAVSVAAVVLAMSAAGGLLWRADGYRRMAQSARDRQVSAFRMVLPNQPAPPDIRARLTSDLIKLRTDHERLWSVPRPPPALPVFVKLLSSLSSDRPVSIEDVRVDSGTLYLQGMAASPADADELAAQLRRAGLSVDPVSTQLAPAGQFSFNLSARSTVGGAEAAK